MPESARTPRGFRPLTKLGALLLLGWLVIVVITIRRGCDSPWWQASRLKAKDPCAAARLLARDVRADYKRSIPSLFDLREIQDNCALLELIRLLDVPDGRNGKDIRRYAWEEIHKRAPHGPGYDVGAPQEHRARQMADWENWYHERFPA